MLDFGGVYFLFVLLGFSNLKATKIRGVGFDNGHRTSR